MAVNSYNLFLKAVFLFGFRSKHERLFIYDLFNKFSYRYTSQQARSFLNPVRYFKKSLTLLCTNCVGGDGNTKAEVYTYDQKKEFKIPDEAYLKYNGIDNTGFVFREQLENDLRPSGKLIYTLLLLVIFFVLLPFIVFRKDRAKISLILLELTENLLLGRELQKAKCKELYVFSAYEKDISFTTYLLANIGIHTHLVPSSNPISLYYKRVICHSFVFTAPFQKSEFEKLKNNWFYTELKSWKPFESQSVKLNTGNDGVPFYKLGLVSSGTYLRQQLKHLSSNNNKDYQSEMALVNGLKKYLHKRKEALIVYLHPFEKSNPENLKAAKNYYYEQFGKEVAFAPLGELSKMHFDLCSVAISGFSSAQIERLYGGYKTLFAPMGFMDNYFSDKRLDKISVQTENELEQLLEKVLSMSDNTFFELYQLTDYRWDGYKTSA